MAQSALGQTFAPPAVLFDAYALLREVQAQNTGGGSLTLAAWTKHTLNTEIYDPAGLVSVASSVMTIQPGTYYVRARATPYQTNRYRLRLRDTTNNADLAVSLNAFTTSAGGNDATMIEMVGRFTLLSSATVELQYYAEAGSGDARAGGVESNITGYSEYYAEVELFREAGGGVGSFSAASIGTLDAGGYFTTDNVEATLQQLGQESRQLAYAEFTANVSITATTIGTANTVVTAPAFTALNVPYRIEFSCPVLSPGGGGGGLAAALYLDGSAIQFFGFTSTQTMGYLCAIHTPAAGSRTYSWRFYRTTSNGTVEAGDGTGSNYRPGFIRVTRA